MNINNLSKYFLKLARNPFKEKEIDILERNIGKYIHFTNVDKIGINYKNSQYFGNNPKSLIIIDKIKNIFKKHL
jgi:hypothetical protein